MDRRLAPQHYDELRNGSGISPEVIEARGAYTESSAARLRSLGFADYQALAPALVLPVHSLNGWDPTYYIKPDRPRTPPGKNKPLKYEYPEGAPNRLDVPAATAAVANDTSVPVMITEGIKKVDAATSAGYHCIGLGGVWNWLGKHDTPFSMPIPDFGYFVWKGRKVAIVFDSDVAINKNVREARRRLKLFLESLGAIVVFVDLPAAADGSKVGIDDYLLTHPDARLWDMAYDPQEERLARMQRKLDEVQRELDTHRDEYKWQRDLDSVDNKALSPGDKLVLRDVRRATRRAGVDAYRDPQTLFYGERVKHTGQSTSMYSKSVHELAEGGAVELVKGKYDNGKEKVSVILRPAFDTPAQLRRVEDRKSGGKQPKHVLPCEDCGPDADVIERKNTVYTCAGCNEVLRTVNQKPTELVRDPAYPADCYPPVPEQEPSDTATVSFSKRSDTDADSTTVSKTKRIGIEGDPVPTHRTPVRCENETVPEPPPEEPGYWDHLTGVQSEPTPEPTPALTLLSDPWDAAPIPCSGIFGDCSQPTFCAKQGRCRWGPHAPANLSSLKQQEEAS